MNLLEWNVRPGLASAYNLFLSAHANTDCVVSSTNTENLPVANVYCVHICIAF